MNGNARRKDVQTSGRRPWNYYIYIHTTEIAGRTDGWMDGHTMPHTQKRSKNDEKKNEKRRERDGCAIIHTVKDSSDRDPIFLFSRQRKTEYRGSLSMYYIEAAGGIIKKSINSPAPFYNIRRKTTSPSYLSPSFFFWN